MKAALVLLSLVPLVTTCSDERTIVVVAVLSSGAPIARSDPTPEEIEDNDNLHLHRISFGFNRRDYGRLRQLIDTLNSQ